MRRTAASMLLLAALCLLSGCAGEPEERPLADLSEAGIEAHFDAPAQDARSDGALTATLYFLNAAGDRLAPVTREIAVPGGSDARLAALAALLDGPAEGEDAAFPELGAEGAWAEFSGRIATVSLPARARALEPETLYAVRLAVTETLTEFPDVGYVNVLVAGREEGVDLGASLPAGTLARAQDLDAASRYARASEPEEGALSCLTTLWFPARGGQYALCEARGVDYSSASPVEYLYTLLAEMGKRPADALAAETIPAPMDYIEEMPELMRLADGVTRVIELRFSAALDDALREAGVTRGAYIASLADTLMGFVPGVDAMTVSIGGIRVTELDGSDTPDGQPLAFDGGLISRQAMSQFTGAPVTLYARAAGGKLTPVLRALGQGERENPRALLEALLALGDEGALPQGLDGTDILAVAVQGSDALVDLSPRFLAALRAMAPEAERCAVYAMVNTLTEGDVRRVTFFFGGRQAEGAEEAGRVELRGGFLRDPGRVVR